MNDHFSSDTKYNEYALSAMTKCKTSECVLCIYLSSNECSSVLCSLQHSDLLNLTANWVQCLAKSVIMHGLANIRLTEESRLASLNVAASKQNIYSITIAQLQHVLWRCWMTKYTHNDLAKLWTLILLWLVVRRVKLHFKILLYNLFEK